MNLPSLSNAESAYNKLSTQQKKCLDYYFENDSTKEEARRHAKYTTRTAWYSTSMKAALAERERELGKLLGVDANYIVHHCQKILDSDKAKLSEKLKALGEMRQVMALGGVNHNLTIKDDAEELKEPPSSRDAAHLTRPSAASTATASGSEHLQRNDD